MIDTSTIRENSISQKRRFKKIKDVWYHFTKVKDEQIESDYFSQKLNKQKNSGTKNYWDLEMVEITCGNLS